MTVETEFRHLRRQKFLVFRRVDLMARGAIASGNRGVLNLFRELVLIVAYETEFGTLCRQEFRCLMFCRMGVRMTGDTATGYHDRVHIFALSLFLVATVTKRLGLGISRRKSRQGQQAYRKSAQESCEKYDAPCLYCRS